MPEAPADLADARVGRGCRRRADGHHGRDADRRRRGWLHGLLRDASASPIPSAEDLGSTNGLSTRPGRSSPGGYCLDRNHSTVRRRPSAIPTAGWYPSTRPAREMSAWLFRRSPGRGGSWIGSRGVPPVTSPTSSSNLLTFVGT